MLCSFLLTVAQQGSFTILSLSGICYTISRLNIPMLTELFFVMITLAVTIVPLLVSYHISERELVSDKYVRAFPIRRAEKTNAIKDCIYEGSYWTLGERET